MARRQARRFTVDEKLRILEEARQPQTTVAEVLRRHGLDAATFYRWERVAKAGDARGVGRGPPQGQWGGAGGGAVTHGAGAEAADHCRGGRREPRAKKEALKLWVR